MTRELLIIARLCWIFILGLRKPERFSAHERRIPLSRAQGVQKRGILTLTRLFAGHWLRFTGHWLRFAGHWLRFIGCWLLCTSPLYCHRSVNHLLESILKELASTGCRCHIP